MANELQLQQQIVFLEQAIYQLRGLLLDEMAEGTLCSKNAELVPILTGTLAGSQAIAAGGTFADAVEAMGEVIGDE